MSMDRQLSSFLSSFLPEICEAHLVSRARLLPFSRNVDLSRAWDGSGARINRVLQKVMRGEKIKTAALGGSSEPCPAMTASCCPPCSSQVAPRPRLTR